MLSVRSTAFALLAAAVTAVRANDMSKIITCYAFDGSPQPNNTRCPGSDACCGLDATCLSNRLCHPPDYGKDTFVRGPCAVKPWSTGQCAQICQYDEINHLPQVATCADGSFCCDKNRDHCCSDGKGVFLDASGNVAKSAATEISSWGPERISPGYGTMTTTPTTPTATSITSTSPPTASTAEPPSNDGQAAKIGAGVGVPVAVIARRGSLLAATETAEEEPTLRCVGTGQHPGRVEAGGVHGVTSVCSSGAGGSRQSVACGVAHVESCRGNDVSSTLYWRGGRTCTLLTSLDGRCPWILFLPQLLHADWRISLVRAQR